MRHLDVGVVGVRPVAQEDIDHRSRFQREKIVFARTNAGPQRIDVFDQVAFFGNGGRALAAEAARGDFAPAYDSLAQMG
jgi:hypothetical protein